MKKIQLLLFISIILSTVALSQKEESGYCDVRPINSKLVIDGRQMFYALPKNSVQISIKVFQTVQTPGPYKNYAEKYLNINDGIIESENWIYKIGNIDLTRNSYPDSSCNYCVSYNGFANLPELQLNSDGVIIACNLPYTVEGYKIPESRWLNTFEELESYSFFDLGAMSFTEEKSETNSRTQQDSTLPKEPISVKKLVATSEEFKAKEAADFIEKLRKRRLKLLVALKDEALAVEGPAMQIMIDELEKLENRYLELFIGKSITQELKFSFEFEPEASLEEEQKIICWFSPSSGIMISKPDVRRSDFKPLLLKSEVIGKLPEFEIQTIDNSSKNKAPIKYGLYYRIPGMLSISIHYTDQILLRQKMQIAQKGKAIPMPSEYLNNSQYGIEFFPETGGLKKVMLKTKTQ